MPLLQFDGRGDHGRGKTVALRVGGMGNLKGPTSYRASDATAVCRRLLVQGGMTTTDARASRGRGLTGLDGRPHRPSKGWPRADRDSRWENAGGLWMGSEARSVSSYEGDYEMVIANLWDRRGRDRRRGKVHGWLRGTKSAGPTDRQEYLEQKDRSGRRIREQQSQAVGCLYDRAEDRRARSGCCGSWNAVGGRTRVKVPKGGRAGVGACEGACVRAMLALRGKYTKPHHGRGQSESSWDGPGR